MKKRKSQWFLAHFRLWFMGNFLGSNMSCLHVLTEEQKVEQDSYMPVTANKGCLPVLGIFKAILQVT